MTTMMMLGWSVKEGEERREEREQMGPYVNRDPHI
jgi:hypothetical protein